MGLQIVQRLDYKHVMKWKNLRRSQNVEDRRGMGSPRGGGGRPMVMKGGCGSIIFLLIILFVFRVDPTQFIGGGGGEMSQPAPQTQRETSAASDELQEFASAIKGSCEDVWTKVFAQHGQRYRPAKMVTYSGATRMRSGGIADARMGPFYLPVEETIYLDTDFFYQMKQQHRAGGDFAYAYVISHEAAHHVQKLLGYTDKVFRQRARVSEREGNQLSVRLELQADFLAGVWAHYADKDYRRNHGQPLLEQGDVQEAMRAAQAIGDDALQRKAQGYVIEDSFTHGTSEQRLRWFMKGFQTGDVRQGDTFSIPYSKL